MFFPGFKWVYYIASVHIISPIRVDSKHKKGIGHSEKIY